MATSQQSTVLILTYNAEGDLLERCLESVANQSAAQLGMISEILVVDNGSDANHRATVASICKRFDLARVVQLDRNYGFSGGINRGLAEVHSPTVLILNNDTVVAPGCIETLVKAIGTSSERCVAVIPKLKFLDRPHVIDAIGNAVNEFGAAFNVGIGQFDIGQYDSDTTCFGACFAAGLFKTKAFSEEMVGKLDEKYFLYYEDVDWNWRANLFGFSTELAPSAEVFHVHSGSTRALGHGFKHRLIERNFIATTTKNFSPAKAWYCLTRRLFAHGVNVIRRHYWRESLWVIGQTLWRLPSYLLARKKIQARRLVSDEQVTAFAKGERPFLNPETYQPITSIEALRFTFDRRRRADQRQGDEEILKILNRVTTTPDQLALEQLQPLLAGETDEFKAVVARTLGSGSN